MAEVAKAFVTVMPSAKGFGRALDGEIGDTFVRAGRRGGQDIGDEMGRSGKQSFAAAGAKMAGAFAVAFAAAGAVQIVQSAVGYLTDAVGSASALEQSVGGVDAVFKESAGSIHEWAEAAADSVGLAQSEYNSLATVLGAQLKNMGIPLAEVAEKTGYLVNLGADLAAQFGGSTSDAVSALSSLLRGERDPIERYGVSINEARLQAKMAEMGLSDLTGEAEAAGKMQATLALLTEQTADAQGAFARESETLAGQQQRLNAELENIKTEIGESLLPVVSELLGVFRDEGVPILQDMAQWFTENQDTIFTLAKMMADSGLSMVDTFLLLGEAALNWQILIYNVAQGVARAMLELAYFIVNQADTAFGWVPGVGEKFDGMRDKIQDTAEKSDIAFGILRDSAKETRDTFSAGRDAVDELRGAVAALDGKKATVFLNASGNAMELFQRAPGLTPQVIPGRATGGPVFAGRPYMVGEREPELFVPGQSGVIMNGKQIAAAVGGAGYDGPPITQNIYPQPRQSEREIGHAAGTALAWQMTGVSR